MSTVLFELTFMLRLSLGLGGASPWALLADATMTFAAALFLRGQRQFMHRPVGQLGRVLAAALAFGTVHVVATLRALLVPMGWPSAQAPPCPLTISFGSLNSAMAAIVTAAKASLTSDGST